MKKLIRRYPWKQLKRGQGFFVPCLDGVAVYEEGLRAAVSVRVLDAKAKIGIIKGKFGVLFVRGPF